MRPLPRDEAQSGRIRCGAIDCCQANSDPPTTVTIAPLVSVVPNEIVPRLCPGTSGRRNRRFSIQKLVGGPGFEPGASRSRTVGKFLQKCRNQSHSVRIFGRGAGSRPDLTHSSAGLLHEVLQKAAARQGDGSHRAEGRCAEPGPHAGHTYSGRAHSPTPRGFEDRDSEVHERPLMPPSDRLLSLSIP